VRGWLISGALRGYKFNNREWRVTRSALRDYIARQAATSDLLRETIEGDITAWRWLRGSRNEDGTDEDAQDGAGDVRVVVQVGTQPLGKAQHPLADGKVGQHVIRDVGGDLGHAACVA